MNRKHLKSYILAVSLFSALSLFAEESTEHYSVGERKPSHEEVTAQSNFGRFIRPPFYSETGVHHVIAISALGDSLEIEDGSVWRISSYDAGKIYLWSMNDVLSVTQNHRWFSQYKYSIVNQTLGESVEANLSMGPLKDGIYTRYVVGLDISRGDVILSDQTRWRVSSYDLFQFADWILYDAVIVGFNSGWDTDSSGYLINVNLDQGVRAELY